MDLVDLFLDDASCAYYVPMMLFVSPLPPRTIRHRRQKTRRAPKVLCSYNPADRRRPVTRGPPPVQLCCKYSLLRQAILMSGGV